MLLLLMLLNWGTKYIVPTYCRLNCYKPYIRQSRRADWTRGEVIRRLTAGQASFGLFRFPPGRGKAY